MQVLLILQAEPVPKWYGKAIAAENSALPVLEATYFNKKLQAKKVEEGVLIGEGKILVTGFIKAIARHRFWEREKPRKVPA